MNFNYPVLNVLS